MSTILLKMLLDKWIPKKKLWAKKLILTKNHLHLPKKPNNKEMLLICCWKDKKDHKPSSNRIC